MKSQKPAAGIMLVKEYADALKKAIKDLDG